MYKLTSNLVHRCYTVCICSVKWNFITSVLLSPHAHAHTLFSTHRTYLLWPNANDVYEFTCICVCVWIVYLFVMLHFDLLENFTLTISMIDVIVKFKNFRMAKIFIFNFSFCLLIISALDFTVQFLSENWRQLMYTK